jgi:PIN domain nuclease of toxin-antitoxin system
LRLLLDTHVVVWILVDRQDLLAQARPRIDEADFVAVSSATLWEIGIKDALGKLDLGPGDVISGLERAGLDRLPITWEHGLAVGDLPLHHRDPFDRLLVAQAITEGLRLLTYDRALAVYGPSVLVV